MKTKIQLKHVSDGDGKWKAKFIVYALVGRKWSPVGEGKSFDRFNTRQEAQKLADKVKLAEEPK